VSESVGLYFLWRKPVLKKKNKKKQRGGGKPHPTLPLPFFSSGWKKPRNVGNMGYGIREGGLKKRT
jgi:hypothetical protein